MLNQEIKNCALNLLSRREHSAYELKQKLSQRQFDLSEIEEVLAALKELNLQSDERFAENYTHYRLERGFGPYRIGEELKARGVDQDLISAAIDFYSSNWLDAAKKVFLKKFPNFENDFLSSAKAKTFLKYRGFTLEQIRNILK
jgi:regulatory protein